MLQGVPSARIFNIQRFSTHDGPGIRTTVFLKGCPLSCWWCHNPENWNHVPSEVYLRDRCIGCGLCVSGCPAHALATGPEGVQVDRERCRHCGACVRVCPAEAREATAWTVAVPDLVATIERDAPFYDQSGGGVTFSGGEPLGQPDVLHAALEQCGRLGIHRAVDTSGFADADVLLRTAAAADLFLYDLKVVDPGVHRRCTGVDNARIIDNLRLLSGAGAEVVVRIPLIPGVSDTDANIAAAGELLAALPRRHPVDLLPFHATARSKYARLGLPVSAFSTVPPTPERVEAIRSELSRYGIPVAIGG